MISGSIPIQMILSCKMDDVEKHINTEGNASDEVLITCFLRAVSQHLVYIHAEVLFLIDNDDKLILLSWCLNCCATNTTIFFGKSLWLLLKA